MHCTHYRINDALARGDVTAVQQAIDVGDLWNNSISNVKDVVGNVDGNLLWELVIAPTFVQSHNAQLSIFIPGMTTPMHARSRHNDRDEHSTRAQYKTRMKARGYAQHGRSKMIVGPWEDETRPAPHADSCEIYAACHCYEAIADAYAEDPDDPQLKMTVDGGLKDVIVLNARVPDAWETRSS